LPVAEERNHSTYRLQEMIRAEEDQSISSRSCYRRRVGFD
jgi:hypothetical protein